MQILLVVCVFVVLCPNWASSQSARGPLYDYVFRPDPNYAYAQVAVYEQPDVTTYSINMTSQRWMDDSEVDQAIWFHYVAINVPTNIRFPEHAMMYISNGENYHAPPNPETGDVPETIRYSNRTGMVTAVIKQIPNQPMNFPDGIAENMREDALIAHTWRTWLEAENKDPQVLLRWPMVKATVRALDTITAFVKSVRPEIDIQKFMLSGISKRAWTLYLHAAIDDRVIAIVPTSLTCLNINENFHHYYRSLGGWSFAMRQYWYEGIMGWLDDPMISGLEELIDPHKYRHNLTLPKLWVSGGSDELFMMDDYEYFFDDFTGDKYIWLMERTGHIADSGPLKEEFWSVLEAFHMSVILDHERPTYTWYSNTTSSGGSVTFVTQQTLSNVTSWAAETPDTVMPRRDFRFKMLDGDANWVNTGLEWKEYPVEDLGGGVHRVSHDNPSEGKYLAFFIKAYFPWEDENRDFIFTSEVNIIPAGFPFPDCWGPQCQGSLV